MPFQSGPIASNLWSAFSALEYGSETHCLRLKYYTQKMLRHK